MNLDGEAKGQGDFEALVKEHQKTMFRLCLNIIGTEEDASEATQMTFVRAYRGFSNFRGDAGIKTWLNRIAINCSRTILKQRSKRRMRNYDQDISEIKIGVGPNLDQQMEEKEQRVLLLNALGRLPEKQRLVLTLRILEEMSFKEIAEVLKIREGSAKTNFHYAVETLKNILGDQNENI